MNNALKLFWPSHCSSPQFHRRSGYIIGWLTKPATACVAAIIPDIELCDLQRTLSEFCASGEYSEFAHINKVCKLPPRILGTLSADLPTVSTRRPPSSMSSMGKDPWITVVLDDGYVPVPVSISHQGKVVDLASYEVIFYQQPNPKHLQFLALDPLELDISHRPPPPHDQKDTATMENLNKILGYSERIVGAPPPESYDLLSVLVQINSSYYLEKGIQKSLTEKRKQCMSKWERLQSGIQTMLYRLWMWMILRPASWLALAFRKMTLGPFRCCLFVCLFAAEVTLHLLNMRLPKFLLNAVTLKDLSTAGQQVDLRLQQLHFWPYQYSMLRKRNWANTAETRAYYISFYNSMWLVANDIIIGLAIGSFLTTNRYIMSYLLHKLLHEYTVESLQSMMLWFLESPAGLKLNHELGNFLSELFLWLIRLWTGCMQGIKPLTPQIIHVIGLSGIFGVSMIISLLSDLLAFMTLHVYCFYMVAARIFNWQLMILYSLFNLFRGKKRNMLRNRIDACDYDLDQLLLGTCLFTLLTFLFPTVLIYYITFALGRVGVIFLQAIMETLLAFFNHFPLFAIMLRVKDPDRLPGGLKFDIFEHDYFSRKYHRLWYFIHGLMRWRRQQHGHKASGKTSPGDRHHHRGNSKKRSSRGGGRPKSVRFKTSNKEGTMITSSAATHGVVDSRHGSYLWMWNSPIPFGAIFFQYMLLWKRLSAHYFSFYYFKCFLYGEPIKPVPKLQYPMLPERRLSLAAEWERLKANLFQSISSNHQHYKVT
ncbi:n-acetylglucosaminyl transferase component gpi1 [Lichtheimia corymbifera JMRC:FSU:9682]|uniref:N-acetylglucosaminyl transferase component gpi1 n=1 Tax=Lichtheimia corymbifera JMRC:FSU:9682 TaxID=1263082 RepID=A0A068RZV9_9FUNG|nr:n-acetylglucosaminyl transferase component gpi1 [Lichtheimia corymbifera JMRC:FSU:9682]